MAIDYSDPYIVALMQLAGKKVKVEVRQEKVLDVAPGKPAGDGFYLVYYYGVVLKPAVRPYPEDNPEGVPCIYIQESAARQTTFALELHNVTEVDDEIPDEQWKEVTMTGLTVVGSE